MYPSPRTAYIDGKKNLTFASFPLNSVLIDLFFFLKFSINFSKISSFSSKEQEFVESLKISQIIIKN